jgi:hypothetical protein
MANKPTTDYSGLDAFLSGTGYSEPAPQPKSKAKPGKTAEQLYQDQEATRELIQARQNSDDAAKALQMAVGEFKMGALGKDQLNKIFITYQTAQDKLYTMDAPSAQKINQVYFPSMKTPAATTGSGTDSGIAPTLVFGPDGKPEKNSDGSYKTQVVDENGNVNGVAPTIVFGPDGKPVKNPDGSYKTQVGATAPATGGQPSSNNKGGGSSSTSSTPDATNAFTSLTQAQQDQRDYTVAGPNVPQDLKSATWAKQYGGIGAMAMTIPWMKDLLAKASVGGWSATKFTNEVKNYTDSTGQKPWDHIAQAYRDSSIAYYDNKQAWAQQYNDKLAILQKSAVTQGLDPSAFGKALDLNDVAAIDAAYKDQHSPMGTYFSTYYNNTPDQGLIDNYVANHSSLAKTDNNVYGGVIGQTIDDLKSYANSMGISSYYLPSAKTQGGAGDWYAQTALRIQQGNTTNPDGTVVPGYTAEQAKNDLKQVAMATYKPFANRINEGMTVQALASPYINAASNLLETSADKIDLGASTGLGYDITKALQGDGTNSMSLDQFMTQIKQRPEWLQTSNARNSVMDTATTFLRNLGMVTGG